MWVLFFLRSETSIRLACWFRVIETFFLFQEKLSCCSTPLSLDCVFLISGSPCTCACVRVIWCPNVALFWHLFIYLFNLSLIFLLWHKSMHTVVLARWTLLLLSSCWRRKLRFMFVLKQWICFDPPMLKCLVRQTGARSPALVAQNVNQTESCIYSHCFLVLHPCSDTAVSTKVHDVLLLKALK